MDSMFEQSVREQIGATFLLLSDWGGEVNEPVRNDNPKYKAARRVTHLIEPKWKEKRRKVDSEAIDLMKW